MGKTGGAADVEGLDYIHIEVKNTERLSLYDALKQAIRDNGDKPSFAHSVPQEEQRGMGNDYAHV